jgi:hypothetical protein
MSGGLSGRVSSITSSEDAREAARQTVEADARAGSADYVEARGMLLPATEYLQQAVEAAAAQHPRQSDAMEVDIETVRGVDGWLLSLVSHLP